VSCLARAFTPMAALQILALAIAQAIAAVCALLWARIHRFHFMQLFAGQDTRSLRGRRHRSETREHRESCGATDKPRVGPRAQKVVQQETGLSSAAAMFLLPRKLLGAVQGAHRRKATVEQAHRPSVTGFTEPKAWTPLQGVYWLASGPTELGAGVNFRIFRWANK
jgi:hypothetical protein